VEGFSTFARLSRENRITSSSLIQLQAVFLLHFEQEYLVVPLNELVLALARQLVNRYPLRTLDAIQLASAQQAVVILGEPMTFVSGDQRLLSAASSEGFGVDNPNAYP
jgi:predicted nucleic acid-binding protein